MSDTASNLVCCTNFLERSNDIPENYVLSFSFRFKSKFFSEWMFLCSGFSLLQSEHPLLQSEHPLFLHFPWLFFKIFFVKLKLFRHNSYYNKNLLRNSSKKWQKVGIHLYENILSEIDLTLNRKYSLRGHILGVLTHTKIWTNTAPPQLCMTIENYSNVLFRYIILKGKNWILNDHHCFLK